MRVSFTNTVSHTNRYVVCVRYSGGGQKTILTRVCAIICIGFTAQISVEIYHILPRISQMASEGKKSELSAPES